MGRKKLYNREDGKPGAPEILLRLDPPIYDHVRSRPEGPRAYVEALVSADRDGLSVTLPEDLQEHLASRPEGPAAYVEGLVRADIAQK